MNTSQYFFPISLNSFPTMASPQEVLTLALAVVLLAFPSLTYGVTLHVIPTSSNMSCSMDPCYTLSEYAEDPGQYFNDSNLTLQFLPGNHTLNVNLTITSIHRLELLGNSSAEVSIRVICNSSVGFTVKNYIPVVRTDSFCVGLTFMDISKMRINGLAFVSCTRPHMAQISEILTYYGLFLQSVQMTEIINCTFQYSFGSALGVVDSHVGLRGNNSFLNNCWLCKLDGGCYPWGPNCYGGGVYTQESNLSFTGSSNFFGNLA